MSIQRLTTILIQTCLFASCLSPIGVDTEDSSGRIIVTGQVSTIPHRNFVQIGKTAGASRQSEAISNLSVWIMDDLGTSYYCVEEEPGKYRAQSLVGIPGRTYHAVVEFPGTGKRYRSKPELLSSVIGTDQVSYDFSDELVTDESGAAVRQQFINFRSKVEIPGAEKTYYLKWTVNEIYLIVPTDFPDPFGNIPPPCYITKTADPQRVVIYRGNARSSLSQKFLVASRIADQKSFHSKHSFYIYRSSITADAYEYWRKVNVLVNQVGTIFDTPPAEIRGNIVSESDPDEIAYGYFQASNETYYRKTLYLSDMPFPPLAYCEYNASKFLNEYPSECLDCLNAANSSLIEPELFKGN